MTKRLHTIGALLVLACTLPLSAQAQPQPDWRHARETQRLENYAQDVLRNNRRECGNLQHVRPQPNGQLIVECTSNNQRRELRYMITPARDDGRRGPRHQGARVDLLSNTPDRDGRPGWHDGRPDWRR